MLLLFDEREISEHVVPPRYKKCFISQTPLTAYHAIGCDWAWPLLPALPWAVGSLPGLVPWERIRPRLGLVFCVCVCAA